MLSLKLVCSIEGTASIHIKYEDDHLKGHAKEVLDTINLIMFD